MKLRLVLVVLLDIIQFSFPSLAKIRALRRQATVRVEGKWMQRPALGDGLLAPRRIRPIASLGCSLKAVSQSLQTLVNNGMP